MTALALQQRPGGNADVHDVLRSPGKPLQPAARVHFESRFQHDFSRVRVHDDESAARSASELEARAWTFGSDVAFGRGMYAPAKPHGAALLGHELRHVVQQDALPYAEPAVAADDHAQPAAMQVQRSALSTFLDVALFIPRLFGLEVFPTDELKEYLETLKKGPRRTLFSDNMARACVSREKELGPYSTEQKVNLVEDMLDGRVSFLDEGSIIALLRHAGDRAQVVGRIGRDRLWSRFDGANRRIIEAVTLTAADANDALAARLTLLSEEENRDYAGNATDPAVKRMAMLSRVTAPVPSGAAVTAEGKAIFVVNGVHVFALPDVIKPSAGRLILTQTEFRAMPPSKIDITPQNANVPVGEDAAAVSPPRLNIWTEYASEEQKHRKPGFGLGTRPQDTPTIRTHERGHGQAWLDFLKNHNPPKFTGTASMLPAAFNAAIDQYARDIRAYGEAARVFSHAQTDCVGDKPTDEMLSGTGFTAAICTGGR